MANRAAQSGVTLVELLLALSISAVVLAAIQGLLKLGLDAQAAGRTANELAYQGHFALELISDQALAVAPTVLGTPAAGTTGGWLAPAGCSGAACVMYCRNAGSQLVETTTADAACTGGKAVATNVSAFSAALPAGAGAADRSAAVFSLTLSSGGTSMTLTSSARLGGGTQ
jgi:prepilin-type N-terminal cleavage/methylation domain-containing protein